VVTTTMERLQPAPIDPRVTRLLELALELGILLSPATVALHASNLLGANESDIRDYFRGLQLICLAEAPLHA